MRNAPPVSIKPDELAALTASLGFNPDETVLRGLSVYLELLMRWNAAMNLVGTRTWQDTLRTLIIDSLHLGPFLEQLPLSPAPLCWDLGAGAGLPGIALRLLWNRGEYWMIEAREKRALFLSTVLARLALPGTYAYRGRLEHFLDKHPAGSRPADIILSRAFMPWRDLLALVGHRLAEHGLIVLLLNEPPPDAAWTSPIGGLRWELHSRRDYTVPGLVPGSAPGAGANPSRTLCALRRA